MSPARIAASHFSPDTRAFIALLDEHRVRYLIVGGEAVIFHGHARLTGDVDFFFANDASNIERLFAALDAFWEGDIPGLSAADELAPEGVVIQFGQPPNRIDLINVIDGVAFEDAWPDRVEAVLVGEGGEVPVRFIGLGALVRNKRASARPKDIDDLDYLERAF